MTALPSEHDAGALRRGMTVQLEAFHMAVRGGMPRVGWKVGLNSAAAQHRFGANEPVAGWLNGWHVLASGATFTPAPESRVLVEAEVCLRVDRDIPSGTTLDMARAAIVELAPALELVDFTRPSSGLEAVLVHSLFHEATVLGAACAPIEIPGLGHELPRVSINGGAPVGPQADAVPDDLARLVVFMGDYLARFGEQLRAGDRMIGGSYIIPVAVPQGSVVDADFGPLGTVSIGIGVQPG